jgi:CRISPR-associated endoribonuclease Cas6/Csy4 subtype I-F
VPFDTYFDLTLCQKQKQETDIPSWVRLAQMWHLVHKASARSNTRFAVAFPHWMQSGFGFGDILRIFTENPTCAEALYGSLETMPQVIDLAVGSRIRPAARCDAYEAFLMHRLPSAPSKKRKSVAHERAVELQKDALHRRLVQQQHLPFVRMRSSSGNAFRLVVERITATADQQGTPNGYGLSRTSQIVALPVESSAP